MIKAFFSSSCKTIKRNYSKLQAHIIRYFRLDSAPLNYVKCNIQIIEPSSSANSTRRRRKGEGGVNLVYVPHLPPDQQGFTLDSFVLKSLRSCCCCAAYYALCDYKISNQIYTTQLSEVIVRVFNWLPQVLLPFVTNQRHWVNFYRAMLLLRCEV